jgi:hypothetical protein
MITTMHDTTIDKKMLLHDDKTILPDEARLTETPYPPRKTYVPSKEYVWIAPGEDGFHEEYDED